MSNGKRDKKKAQKKQHVSPPAVKQNKSSVAKPKTAAGPSQRQRQRGLVSMKVLYAAAAVLLVLSTLLVAISRDNGSAAAVATPNVGNFNDRTPIVDQTSQSGN